MLNLDPAWRTRGYFTRQDALAAGYLDRDLTAWVRGGLAERFRRGAYAFADDWAAMSSERRHIVRLTAVAGSLGDRAVASHVSAVLMHGIDVWDVPLDRAHVTRLDSGAGRIERDLVHHEGKVDPAEIASAEGIRVVRPARAVLEAASRVDGEHALVLLDAGLRAGAFTREELEEQYAAMSAWPFMQHLHVPVRMADARAGSVGESRGRWRMWRAGLPAPELQFAVHRADGTLIGLSDWGWKRHRLLGEFDGRIKYGRLLRPGQGPEDVVFDEKLREDEMRAETGYAMVRFTWDDFTPPGRFERKLARALGL